MKKKNIIIICIVAVVLILATIITVICVKNKKKTKLFEDSDYPVTYEKKDGNIVVTLKSKDDKGLSWNVYVRDSEYVDVKSKKDEKKGKASYIISPKERGNTEIIFSRTNEISGFEYIEAQVIIPVYVYEDKNAKLIADIVEEPVIDENKTAVIAENTDHPFVIINEDNVGYIIFVNGASDWTITDENDYFVADIETYGDNSEIAYLEDVRSMGGNPITGELEDLSKADSEDTSKDASDNNIYDLNTMSDEEIDAFFSQYEASATDAFPDYNLGACETTLTISSESMGITQKVKLSIDDEGNMTLKKIK